MITSSVVVAAGLLAAAAPPSPRIAVLLEDPGASAPIRAQVEIELQQRGYTVVAAEVSERMRKVVAPKDLLNNRLPEGLSVFEADAIVAGAASYGETTSIEGVQTAPVSLTARLIDLGTGRTTTTIQTHGRGMGIGGPTIATRGAKKAVAALFEDPRFETALSGVGQRAGSVTLIVRGIPSREALLEVRRNLERALAGAPVKEIYYATGLGKLMLGGSKAKSMVGPDIADVIGETKSLPLTVGEVANTRIVATYSRARTLSIHALVLQPKLPKRLRKRTTEIGKYVATRIATFDYARASYQPGRLTRAQAKKRAHELGAHVIIESEILGVGDEAALAIRVLDARTGRPIHRGQEILSAKGEELTTAETMLATLGNELPERLAERSIGHVGRPAGPQTAAKE